MQSGMVLVPALPSTTTMVVSRYSSSGSGSGGGDSSGSGGDKGDESEWD